ncbi:MAG: hypothetical protein IPN73_02055 [Saprospiraceae bacterium]|nr:hypothetical protein [Saprospiraceae bacterium]
MTLEQLIQQYKTEEYKFWKYHDKDGKNISTHFFFETHSDYLDKYLGFYKDLPNLTEVIVYAAEGIFKITNQGIDYFIRHNHQEVFLDKKGNLRGVPYEVSKQVRNNIIMKINNVLQARSFDEIYSIVESCKVKGFGELSIYDTSMRIASKLNIEPDKVYLHAGARKGMEILEAKGYVPEGTSKKKYVDKKDLPLIMQALKAADIEHLCCSMKKELEELVDRLTADET